MNALQNITPDSGDTTIDIHVSNYERLALCAAYDSSCARSGEPSGSPATSPSGMTAPSSSQTAVSTSARTVVRRCEGCDSTENVRDIIGDFVCDACLEDMARAMWQAQTAPSRDWSKNDDTDEPLEDFIDWTEDEDESL